MFAPKPTLVCGTGEIARLVTGSLRAGQRPVESLNDLDAAGSLLRSARTIVLADPISDPGTVANRLVGLCRKRSRRLPALRVILLQARGSAPALPDLPADAPLAIETLDLERQAARTLLGRWPLHSGMDPPFGQGAHLLIVGSAPPARALAAQALRLMHYGETRPILTLASRNPARLRDDWLAAYPQSSQFCDLRFCPDDDPDLADAGSVTGVFVCQEPSERGLETAHRLARLIADRQAASPLVFLEVGAAEPVGDIGTWDGQIVPFSWLREVCRPEVLLDGLADELARVIHDHYRDSIAAQGRDPAVEPAGRPWEFLAASYRDANRQQADHIWAKLAVADCRAVWEDLVESFAFSPLEAERLAVIEHSRWAADRHLDGWTYAPVRDNARKHHPQLVPYADLSEPMKDLDRFAVRLIPALLARSGRGVVRILLVGVPEAGEAEFGNAGDGHRLKTLADEILERLVLRYPDRSLVLASTLAGAQSRQVVRRAVAHFGAGLFLLCPLPLQETLEGQPSQRARRDLLELAALAERRITLNGARELAEWFARRAEIQILCGMEPDTAQPRKRVWIDPSGMKLAWNFEY